MTGKRRSLIFFFFSSSPFALVLHSSMFSFFSHLKVLREEKAKVCNDKCFQCVDRRAGDSPAWPYRGHSTEVTSTACLWMEMFQKPKEEKMHF